MADFAHRTDRATAVPELKKLQTVGTLPDADKRIAAGYDNICIDGIKRALGNKGALLLVRLLSERPRALRRLQIDGHQIGDKGGAAIFDFLATDKSLASLEIGDNNLGPVAMKSCYAMLKANVTLTHLDFYMNKNIGETGGILIGSCLRVNNTLKSLCLNQCNIPAKGMLDIADALKHNSSINLLSAGGNCNNPKVAKAIAECLEVNTTLRSLTLNGGSIKSKRIKDEGMGYICISLGRNITLSKLLLARNSLKDASLLSLGKLLAINKSLRILDLSKNKFTDRGYVSVIEGMKVNKTLISLDMSHKQSSALFQLQTMVSANAERHGDFTRATFEDVLKDSTAKGQLNRTKLMLIGQGRAGKTATVRALFGEPFEPEWKSTVAASVNVAKVTASTGWSKVEGKAKYKFAVDFAAKIALKDIEQYETKLAEDARPTPTAQAEIIDESGANAEDNGDDVAVAVGTDLNGNEEIQARVENIDESHARLTNQASAHLLSVDDEIAAIDAPVKDYKNYTKQYHNDLFVETNQDRDAVRFTIWDYGGQRVFYSLHHLFMSKLGVYLLVFSMKELQDSVERGKAYLEFWLNTLSLHAPDTPLILVGTFWDELEGKNALTDINNAVNEVLERFPFNVIMNERQERHDLSFFPLTNKNGNGIGLIRETIDKTARDLDHMGTELPITWIYVIEHLLTKYKKPYIKLEKFKEIALSLKVKDETEAMNMLQTFSDLGLVLHLTQTTALQNMIVLKPQWLITNFGRIIRDEKLHEHNKKFVKRNNLEDDVVHLFQDGLVSEDFLLMVWKEHELEYLLDMMKQTLMLSDWTFKNSSVANSEKIYYFVPSLVTGSRDIEDYDGNENFNEAMKEKLTYDEFINKYENIQNFAFFQFKYLPDGVFDRLICLCVAHSNLLKVQSPPIISKGVVEISFGEGETIRLYNEVKFSTIVLEIDESSQGKAAHALLKIQSMMQKLRADIIGEGLGWEINFHTNDKQLKAYDEAAMEKLAPFFGQSEDLKAPAVSIIEHIDVNQFLEGLQDF